MTRLIIVTFMMAASAAALEAQTNGEQPKNEFFAGYSFQSADINTLTIDPHRTPQNGVNLEYIRNLSRRIGLTGDASAHFHRETRSTGAGRFSSQRDQYFLLGGLQFKAGKEKRVRPFAQALFGVSLFRGFTADIRPSGNVYTYDDATSFAMALGGGLDVSVSRRIAVRLIQFDYTPTFFGSGRQDNFRISAGIIFKR
jgi:opacity protein-like surface antigen